MEGYGSMQREEHKKRGAGGGQWERGVGENGGDGFGVGRENVKDFDLKF